MAIVQSNVIIFAALRIQLLPQRQHQLCRLFGGVAVKMIRTLAESIISKKTGTLKVASQPVIDASCLKFINGTQTKPETEKQEFIRSQSDKFDYKLIQLQNGIRILLISDPSYKELGGSNSSSRENVNAMETSDTEGSDQESSDCDSMSSNSSSDSKVFLLSYYSSIVLVNVIVLFCFILERQ